MEKENININLSAEEHPTAKRLKEMVKSEKKIEEAAQQKVTKNEHGICRFSELIGDPIAGTELGNLIKRMFIAGAKSEEAKEYHTKGMYTEDEVIEFLSKQKTALFYCEDSVIRDSVAVWFNKNKTK